jgi:hypothetical protein
LFFFISTNIDMSNKRSNAFEQQFGIDSSKMVNHVAGLLLSWKQMRELGTFIAGKPLGRDKMEAYPLCLREVEKTNHRLIVFDGKRERRVRKEGIPEPAGLAELV